MGKFTYWNSQSFRTLNHWQSNGAVSSQVYTTVNRPFSALIVDGVRYVVPFGLKEPGSTRVASGIYYPGIAETPTCGFYKTGHPDFSAMSVVKKVSGEEVKENHETQEWDKTGKKVCYGVWDGGTVELESSIPNASTSGFDGTWASDNGQIILGSYMFRNIDGSTSAWKTQYLTTPDSSGTMGANLILPTVHKHYGVYYWVNSGYESLLPEWLQTLYEDGEVKKSDATTVIGDDNSNIGTVFGTIVRLLNTVYKASKTFSIRVKGNVTMAAPYSQTGTRSLPYLSYIGGYRSSMNWTNYTMTGFTENVFSTGIGGIDTTYNSDYLAEAKENDEGYVYALFPTITLANYDWYLGSGTASDEFINDWLETAQATCTNLKDTDGVTQGFVMINCLYEIESVRLVKNEALCTLNA